MKTAHIPDNEADRLQALLDYQVLDTPPEKCFDDLTQLASDICQMPIALVSLIDDKRQWFKSHHGVEATETPREYAFCAHAILDDNIFEVIDSRQDERFSDNPLVTDPPHVIAYSGVPLKTPTGFNIGTLCVIDHEPKALNETQKAHLRILAREVVSQLELRKVIDDHRRVLDEQRELLQIINEKNDELSQFSYRTSHDLRSPLVRMSQLAEVCMEDVESGDLDAVKENCGIIKKNCVKLNELISDIISLTRADLRKEATEEIDFEALVNGVFEDVGESAAEKSVRLESYINQKIGFYAEAVRLRQIFYNLISNSIKYCNMKNQERFVKVVVTDLSSGVCIKVSDNGLGIPEAFREKVFDMFERFHPDVESGSGLGTTIVKRHVTAMHGIIEMQTDQGGTEFSITIPNAL